MLARGGRYQNGPDQLICVEVAANADHVSAAKRWRLRYPAMVIAPRPVSAR